MIAWTALQIAGEYLQSALAWLVEWTATLGSVGLLVAGIALLIYSAIPLLPYRVLAAPLGVIAAVAGLWMGFTAAEAYGRRTGIAEEKARWQAASKAEAERQAIARQATEAAIDRAVLRVSDIVAGLHPLLQDIKNEATKEDVGPPLPPPRPGCPLEFRGLPPGLLLKLDGIGR